MYTAFNNLPSSAKVWIYQADRKLNPEEIEILSRSIRSFTEQWQVHGMPLQASFEIKYGQFVILAADDKASGCSIDSSVRVMKEIGEALRVDFFNRSLIAFLVNDNVDTIPMASLLARLQSGNWDAATYTFNNAVSSIEEYRNRWLVTSAQTWLKRYLDKKPVVE
jgi:hypothetical protein